MGQQLSFSQLPQTDKLEILATGLSASFDCKVVTKSEYDRRKDEPEFRSAEDLDIKFFEKLCYEPVKGQYGDVFGENGKAITIFLKSLSGRQFELTVGEKSYVEELKFVFEEQHGIPVDHKRLIFTFKGKKLQDGFKLSDYEIVDNSELSFTVELKASAESILVLSPDLLMPRLDYDFTNKQDNGTVYERGGHRYNRPYGWYRFALNVNGKYEDDIWLGEHRNRTESSPDEWPVCFHGTERQNVEGIATNGYQLSKGQRKRYGKGIYSSPSIEVAELYAVPFTHGSRKCKLVFQNRVKSNDLEIIAAEAVSHPKVKGDYWMQPHEEYIRPYGICIKQY